MSYVDLTPPWWPKGTDTGTGSGDWKLPISYPDPTLSEVILTFVRLSTHLDRRLGRMERLLRTILAKEEQLALDVTAANAALDRLGAEVSETAAELRRLADIIATGDLEDQAVLDDVVARINAQADALDALQPKPA